MRRLALPMTLAALAIAATGRAEDGPVAPPHAATLEATIATGFPVSEQRVLDVDRDGKSDLLVVGLRGEVRVWRHDAAAKRFGAAPAGSLVLRLPDRTLLAVADLLGDGSPPQLVEMTKDGVSIHRVETDGAYSRGGDVVAPRAKFPLRVGRPQFAEIARDVNGDGRADLVVPRGDECDLWLNGGLDEATKLPAFTKAATIRMNLQREIATKSDALSDVLESSFRIPNLRIADVNGDGRRDLYVENGKTRSWHLQREDGSLPAAPDVTLDLSIYRDTTPEASVQLGRTLAGGDDQRLETRDLDGDGIQDHVIAHRRKVWVFHGTRAGPQFTEPSDILRVADDVTALMLVRLDGDAYPDLLLLRVQVPTIATILRGLISEWDVEISALGYASDGGKKFETTPKWKGGADVRLPALLPILRNPEALVKRFEDVAKKFRRSVAGDFDGDGMPDVALLDESGERVNVYASQAGGGGEDGERAIGDLFFGDETRTWDLDSILSWLGDVAERQASHRTGGRAPIVSCKLRSGDGWQRTGIDAGDLDGDGRAELVIAYEHAGQGVFDLVRIR